MMPIGFKFNPTDEELIEILNQKVAAIPVPLRFIIDTNVYEHEPQDLQYAGDDVAAFISNNERYYFCKKVNDSREVSGRGWWKATSHVKKIFGKEGVIGSKRPLTFHRFKDNTRKRSNAIKTSWIMHEYSLESNTAEWRLCKIKHKGNSSREEEIANTRQSCTLSSDVETNDSSTSMQQGCLREQQQQQSMLVDNAYRPYYFENVQPKSVVEGQDQHPGSPYDPCLLLSMVSPNHLSRDLHEEAFPTFWSWQD